MDDFQIPDLEVSELQGGGVLGHDLAGLLESLTRLLLPLGRNNLRRRNILGL